MMTGGSSAHSLIQINLVRLIANHLNGQACRAYNCDMRVKVKSSGLYTYPDLSIACPPIEIEKKGAAETLVNPAVLFEVLSPSTANYDRSKKFDQYSLIPSLREYVLVSQDEPRVEKRVRATNGTWALSVASGLHETLRVESIDCVLRLDEIYAKVEFEPAATSQPQEPSR